MQVEKEFKRDNGDTLKIFVNLFSYLNESMFDIAIWIKPNRKRIYKQLDCTDEYDYRKLAPKDREAYRLKFFLNYVTISEINEVKHLLIDKLQETITDKID